MMPPIFKLSFGSLKVECNSCNISVDSERNIYKKKKCIHSLKKSEQGLALIEVMLAMGIFAFGVLAAGNSNTLALSAIRTADVHGHVNNLAHEMLEILKADKGAAVSNEYNVDYDQTTPAINGAAHVNSIIAEWRSRIELNLPGGVGKIECDSNSCRVSLRWYDTTIPGQDTLTYNVMTVL